MDTNQNNNEEQITEQITDKRLENLKPAWKKGESGNPEGRPKGQRNYATIYREALEKLAMAKGVSPEDMEVEILQGGLLNARRGDYRFYKDVLDRQHGQAIQKTEHSGDLNIIITKYNGSTPTT